jgi:hypothetical protein
MTVRFYCGVSVIVRLAVISVVVGVAVGIFLGAQLASLAGF